MAEPRQLAKPPITEALVDLRIVSNAGIGPEQLQPLRAGLAELYPKFDEKRQFEAEFRVEGGRLMPPTSQDLGFQGLWLTSADGTRIAQFRPDGFTFNNVGLEAYMGGEALLDEALGLWSRFSDLVKPEAVTRLALRYLNRLDLPLRVGDEFTRFLTAPPELPDGAPQTVTEFLSRIVSHDETGATAIVTQKLERTETFPVPVIVDIDVFFLAELEPHPDNLRSLLETLRNLKNRTFFALLTEEAVRLCE